jgi:glycosyltransferase involved in cell wall biosynthesis
MRRLSVLVSAHELSPGLGSECGVGWNLVTRLGRYHDITVLHAGTNQFGTSDYTANIKKYILESGPVPGVTFVEVPQPISTRVINKINKWFSFREASTGFPPLYFWGYKFWQKAAWGAAKSLIRHQRFDLIHLITAISYREPGYLSNEKIPFIWGPTSGTFNTPDRFVITDGFGSVATEVFRRGSNFFNQFISRRIAGTIRRSALIYPVSKEDDAFFQSHGAEKTKVMLEAGAVEFPDIVIPEIPHRIQLVWCGRMVSSKGLKIFLYSIKRCGFKPGEAAITIIGDGPLLRASKHLAEKLGLQDIIWTGKIPREEVFSRMKDADILVHTSYKEATPNVVVEALSVGAAVICHDAFGMAVAVTDSCGIKISLKSPEESIRGFSQAIKSLVYNPDKIRELRVNAIQRAKELSWDKAAARMAADYLEICTEHESTGS